MDAAMALAARYSKGCSLAAEPPPIVDDGKNSQCHNARKKNFCHVTCVDAKAEANGQAIDGLFYYLNGR